MIFMFYGRVCKIYFLSILGKDVENENKSLWKKNYKLDVNFSDMLRNYYV